MYKRLEPANLDRVGSHKVWKISICQLTITPLDLYMYTDMLLKYVFLNSLGYFRF